MSYSRISGILDLELSQHLSFGFSIDENLTRPGSATIRPRDRFLFTVWASNNTAIPLRSIDGTIAPRTLAEFEPTEFSLSHLGPRGRRLVARIEGTVIGNFRKGGPRFDHIGEVQVSIRPDLSHLCIEKSRPMVYLK